MAASTGIKLQGRLRVDLAPQFGDFSEVGSTDFDVIIPTRVTGSGSVATIHVDEHELQRKLAAGSAAFVAATAEQPETRADDTLVTFCEDVLGVKLTAWQRRTLSEWFAARGGRAA